MYYITLNKNVGPNQSEAQYVDSTTIEISTLAAKYVGSDEECLNGHCGTYNDWSTRAYGSYDTLEQAEQAVIRMFGDVREMQEFEFYQDSLESVVRSYRPGKYVPMADQQTADWLYDGMVSDITADTTDERLAELLMEYEGEANDQGYTLSSSAEDYLKEYRDSL